MGEDALRQAEALATSTEREERDELGVRAREAERAVLSEHQRSALILAAYKKSLVDTETALAISRLVDPVAFVNFACSLTPPLIERPRLTRSYTN